MNNYTNQSHFEGQVDLLGMHAAQEPLRSILATIGAFAPFGLGLAM